MNAVRVVIEDGDNAVLHVMTLPEKKSDDYRDEFWEVPLYNPYNDVIGKPESMYIGNVWFDRHGHIVTTSVPTPLRTSDDARRYAIALLAAADAKDELDKEEKS